MFKVVVEAGQLTDGPIDQVGQFGRPQRVDIGLHGNRALGRWPINRADDGLAADDHELILVRDLGSGPDQVFELRPLHWRMMASRTPGCNALPKGDACRNC